MTSNTICRTRLIADDPATKDNFGSHKRVALALARMIENSAGGKSIGLEGGWGSGKTTIVEILCERFQPDPHYFFFKFDAWAHEGDPLRRTFLEALIDELTRSKPQWIANEYWQEQKEIIAQRKEIKETNTEPHLKPLGMVVLFLVALIPVGVAFLNAGLRDTPNLTVDFRNPIANKFVIGLLLTTAPLLAILLGLFVETLQNLLSKKRRNGAFLWAMLVNKAITRERTETNKTANPTSVEFEAIFGRLMAEALDEKERRVILVLDNLDRIGAAEALKIWATLQTFLRPRVAANAEWLKRLWVLMPYDPDGISALWSKPKGDEERKESSTQPKAGGQNAPDAGNLAPAATSERPSLVNENAVALSFLDKSFQLRFEVPPPVLSDWHNYLIDIFQDAFPDHQVEDFHNPYRLYVWYLNKRKRLPNPRQIKLYVNQIGAIHRQWTIGEDEAQAGGQNPTGPAGDTFPLSHIAYYVLLRRMNYPLIDLVLKGELPEAEVEGLLDDHAADNLAALAFNVDVATAKQIVLNNPLQEAFEIRSVDKLKELYEQHKDKGFWEALDTIDWGLLENKLLANAAYCLKESNLLDKTQQPPERHSEIQSILSALRKESQRQSSWEPFNSEMAQGISALYTLIPEQNFVDRLAKQVASNFVWKNVGDSVVDVAAWIASAQMVRDGMPVALTDAFARGLLEPVAQRFYVEQPMPHKQLGYVIEFFVELSLFDDAARQSLSKVATEGRILHQLQSLIATNPIPALPETNQAIAWCLLTLLRHNLYEFPEDALYHGATYSSDGKDQPFALEIAPVAEPLTQLLSRYNSMQLLFTYYAAAPSTEPFVLQCVRTLLEQGAPASLFSAALITQHWNLFQLLQNDEQKPSLLDTLLVQLVREPAFIEEFCLIDFMPERAKLYTLMSLQGGLENPDFRNWLARQLESITEEDWLTDLRGDGRLFQIILGAQSLLRELRLQFLQGALAAFCEDVIYGRYVPANAIFWGLGARTLIAHAASSESDEQRFRRHLYELVLNANGQISDLFFRHLADEILRPDLITGDAQVFSKLFEPLLKQGSVSGLKWLEKTLENNLDSLKTHSTAFLLFRDVVRDLLYKNGFGDEVTLTRKKDVHALGPFTVRRNERSELWAPDPRQEEFTVDWATAEAALASGAFEATQKILFGDKEWIFGENSRVQVNIGRLLEIPPLTDDRYR